MRNILVTGGTGFVSGAIAGTFVGRGDSVTVLNRGNSPQPAGVNFLQADRHETKEVLKGLYFDVILDVTAYSGADVESLLDAVEGYGTYILISSSAVYPETAPQPFSEETELGANRFWGAYGTGKIEAEAALTAHDPDAYILRPPYLYGPGNNLYREAFVFDCALAGRPFYLPGNGGMNLQFFHIRDLCRFIEILLEKQPEHHIFNVGNPQAVSVLDWVSLCYTAAGSALKTVSVSVAEEQRNYFPFYRYEYFLDVKKQGLLMPETVSLEEGLRESLAWYTTHPDFVRKKPLISYIDEHLKSGNL